MKNASAKLSSDMPPSLKYEHQPVLVPEVLRFWHCRPGGFYVDATVGLGGHSEALLLSDPGAHLLGLDVDQESVDLCRKRLEPFSERVAVVKEGYMNLAQVLQERNLPAPDGILADFGVSSLQLDRPERGFSFMRPGPVDMRMDLSRHESAAELIEKLSVEDLTDLLRHYGEEKHARRIAHTLKLQIEKDHKIDTVSLAKAVESVYARTGNRKEKIHPATRTFQALRIAVNNEMNNLEEFLDEAPRLLNQGGTLACISYHSLEDSKVKSSMTALSRGCVCPPDFPQCACGRIAQFRVLTKKPVRPSEEEIARNPRSRSARMRVLEKI